MRPKFKKRSALKFDGRIIPKAKRRDNFGSNSPPLGAYFPLNTPLLAAGYSFGYKLVT